MHATGSTGRLMSSGNSALIAFSSRSSHRHVYDVYSSPSPLPPSYTRIIHPVTFASATTVPNPFSHIPSYSIPPPLFTPSAMAKSKFLVSKLIEMPKLAISQRNLQWISFFFFFFFSKVDFCIIPRPVFGKG